MEKLLISLGGILLFFILAALLALPTMLLWNWLMPDIFGLTVISFWQAWGLNILTGIFFRSSKNSTKD